MGAPGIPKASKADEGNCAWTIQSKAAFKIRGSNGSSFVFLLQQVSHQDRAQDLFNGSVFLVFTTQFRGNGVGQFRKPHHIPAQLLVVHARVSFHQQDCSQLVHQIVVCFLQEHAIYASFPSVECKV